MKIPPLTYANERPQKNRLHRQINFAHASNASVTNELTICDKTAAAAGSIDYVAGQDVGLVKEMKPAAESVRELLEGARHIPSTLTMELEL
jgi:hypothetical protein